MPDREKVIKGLECCTQHGSMCGSDCNGHYERYTDDGYVIKLADEYRSECPYGKCETGCVKTLAKDALELLKEQQTEYVDMGVDFGHDGILTHRWDCKSCEYEIYGKSIIGLKYCPNCGKAVVLK